jgi:hypothetical protein
MAEGEAAMDYPSILTPTSFYELRLTERLVYVPKATPVFQQWAGPPVEDSYNGKAVVYFEGEPVFAELATLRAFQRAGWHGVWIDAYMHRYRIGYWQQDASVALPPRQEALLKRINNNHFRGSWDVFCWKDSSIVFAKLILKSNDKIREAQVAWLEAALAAGLPIESFLIVEWEMD